MTIRVVAAPTIEPVTLEEGKLHVGVDHSLHDTMIGAIITAARIYAENYTRRAFVRQTLELLLPCFPCDGTIELPRPPLQSITHVKYMDFDGVLQTIDPSLYQVDLYSQPALIKPTFLQRWPVLNRDDFNAVQVRYVAGYPVGSPENDAIELVRNVPEPIKQWVKIRLATHYDTVRDAVNVGNIVTEMKRDFVDGLLDPYIVSLF